MSFLPRQDRRYLEGHADIVATLDQALADRGRAGDPGNVRGPSVVSDKTGYAASLGPGSAGIRPDDDGRHGRELPAKCQ